MALSWQEIGKMRSIIGGLGDHREFGKLASLGMTFLICQGPQKRANHAKSREVTPSSTCHLPDERVKDGVESISAETSQASSPIMRATRFSPRHLPLFASTIGGVWKDDRTPKTGLGPGPPGTEKTSDFYHGHFIPTYVTVYVFEYDTFCFTPQSFLPKTEVGSYNYAHYIRR